MSARILDGRAVAERLRAEVAEKVATLVGSGRRPPGLAVVLVGDNPASHVYVRNKGVATRKAGMVSTEHRLPADVSQTALLDTVARLNADDAVDGVLVQLPLPPHIAPRRCWPPSTRTRTWTASMRSTSGGCGAARRGWSPARRAAA